MKLETGRKREKTQKKRVREKRVMKTKRRRDCFFLTKLKGKYKMLDSFCDL